MKLTNCSMGCAYATGPIDKCLCSCKGATHGFMVMGPVAAQCTPSVAIRCKGGTEGGECRCACGGLNHGLYTSIADFDRIPITGLASL